MPIAGCLADIRFGRYKVISFSIWIMWLTSLLLTAGLVIGQLVDLKNNNYYHNIMFIVLVVPLALGYSGYQANVVQFGVDQLFDASSSEIMSFVIWFTWTIFSSLSTVGLIIMYTSNEYKLIAPLFMCINLTLDGEQLFLTMKTTSILVSTLERANMEVHLQENRLKMLKPYFVSLWLYF